MSDELFRREALNHQRQRLLGTVVLRQSWVTKALSWLIAGIFLGLAVISSCYGFSRQETLGGVLLPAGGLILATTRQAGEVVEVRAKIGQSVRADQVLFVLSAEQSGERGQTRSRVNAALEEQARLGRQELEGASSQNALKRATLDRRWAELHRQLSQTDRELEVQLSRLALAKKISERFAAMALEHAASEQTADEKAEDALSQRARLLALQARRDLLTTELAGVAPKRLELELELERDLATLKSKVAATERELAENDGNWRWEVRAPRAGKVTMISAEVGQSTDAGKPLAGIMPSDAQLEAVLQAPSRAVGLMRVGMPVHLRFDGLPYQRFGQFSGVALEISRSPVPATVLPNGNPSSPEAAPMYRVRVSLAAVEVERTEVRDALQPGMQVQGAVSLEYRKFYEWAFEPIIGLRRRAM